MSQSKPEKTFRIGFVSASVFSRQINTDGGEITLRSVNLQRRYMDEGEAKYSSSFGLAELPQAIAALKLAMDHVAEQEAAIG